MKFSHVVDGSNIKQNFSSKILMLNGSFDFYQSPLFSSFVTAGFGHAWNKAGDYSDSENNSIQNGATSSEFAWKVGLGIRYAFNEKLSFNLSYNYIDLNKFKTSQVLVDNLTGAQVVAPVTKTKLPLHVIGLGIKYKF